MSRRAVKAGLVLAALSALTGCAPTTEVFDMHEEFAAALRDAGPTCANPTYASTHGDRSYVTADCVAHFGSDVRGGQVWGRLVIRHEVAHLATMGHMHDATFRAAEARILRPVHIFAAYAHEYRPGLEGTGAEYPAYASARPLDQHAQTASMYLKGGK